MTPAAELKPDTHYGHRHLKCPASTRPDICVGQFNLFKTWPETPTDGVVLLPGRVEAGH